MRRRTKAGHAACGAPLARARCLSANPVCRGCAECSLRTTAIAIRGRATWCLSGVRSSACIDCHRHPAYAPGGNPFCGEPEIVKTAQYLSGGRMFGPFTSANRTPYFFGKAGGIDSETVSCSHAQGSHSERPTGRAVAGHALASLWQEDRARPDGNLRVFACHTVTARQPYSESLETY